eukprot:5269052-Pyramimonas_sp.AAC.1
MMKLPPTDISARRSAASMANRTTSECRRSRQRADVIHVSNYNSSRLYICPCTAGPVVGRGPATWGGAAGCRR